MLLRVLQQMLHAAVGAVIFSGRSSLFQVFGGGQSLVNFQQFWLLSNQLWLWYKTGKKYDFFSYFGKLNDFFHLHHNSKYFRQMLNISNKLAIWCKGWGVGSAFAHLIPPHPHLIPPYPHLIPPHPHLHPSFHNLYFDKESSTPFFWILFSFTCCSGLLSFFNRIYENEVEAIYIYIYVYKWCIVVIYASSNIGPSFVWILIIIDFFSEQTQADSSVIL